MCTGAVPIGQWTGPRIQLAVCLVSAHRIDMTTTLIHSFIIPSSAGYSRDEGTDSTAGYSRDEGTEAEEARNEGLTNIKRLKFKPVCFRRLKI